MHSFIFIRRTSINSALHRSIDGVVACTDVDALNAAELIRRYNTDKTSLDEFVDASVPLAARRSMVAGVAHAMRRLRRALQSRASSFEFRVPRVFGES